MNAVTETVIVAVIAAAGTLAVGILTAVVTIGSLFWRRMLRAESNNVALWTYTRHLIDHIYRGGVGPPPPPPEHIAHLYETGD